MVREVAAGDARAVAEVHVRPWRAAYLGFLPGRLLDDLSVGSREDFWVAALGGEGPPAFTLVFDDRTGPLETSARSPCLAATTTRASAPPRSPPPTWTPPAGTPVWAGALLGRALARLREDDWQDVTLWVFLRKAQGRAFYERSGFRLNGAKGKHETSGMTTTRMRLAL